LHTGLTLSTRSAGSNEPGTLPQRRGSSLPRGTLLRQRHRRAEVRMSPHRNPQKDFAKAIVEAGNEGGPGAAGWELTEVGHRGSAGANELISVCLLAPPPHRIGSPPWRLSRLQFPILPVALIWGDCWRTSWPLSWLRHWGQPPGCTQSHARPYLSWTADWWFRVSRRA
jgi:hypothetical protein